MNQQSQFKSSTRQPEHPPTWHPSRQQWPPSQLPPPQFQQPSYQPQPLAQQTYGQPQWQQPYRPPEPPRAQPRRSRRSRRPLFALLGLVIVLVCFVYLAMRLLVLPGHVASIPVTNLQATQSTQQVATQVTANPTRITYAAGRPILGADISTFIAKYGQPDALSNAKGGIYFFQPYGKTHTDFLTVTTARNNPPPYTARTLIILANAPPNKGWSVKQAQAVCLTFTPSDAVFKHSSTFPNTLNPLGVQKVYYSASLSQQLPASDFVNSKLKPSKSGTFSVVLNYGISTARVVSCSVQVALQ